MELLDVLFTPIGYTLILPLAILYFLWKSMRVPTYWQDQGVAYVKPLPLIGSVLERLRKPMNEIELERYNKYGAVYGYYNGSLRCLSVAEPKLLRKILVKDFQFFPDRMGIDTGNPIIEEMMFFRKGEDWKRIRTITSPTFTTGKIKRNMETFKSCSRTLVEHFNQLAKSGTLLDGKKLYTVFAMDSITSSLLSIKLDYHNEPNNPFFQLASNYVTSGIEWKLIFYVLIPRLLKLFKVPFALPEGVKLFQSATIEIISERERTGQKGNDFLQLLMDSTKEQSDEPEALDRKDEILSNYERESNDHVFRNYAGKKSMTFGELVAQSVQFFVAGLDTSSATLAFSAYQLALNEEVQEKLIMEIDDVIQSNKGIVTYEVIQSMKYLDNVISETLRMFPPVMRLQRLANVDYVLEDTKITIPKGAYITVPVIALHYDPKYFPDPETFDPDRFTPEEKAKRDSFTYMPFGIGPRKCIGMNFALVQIKVCLIYVLSHFRIERCTETKVPLEYNVGTLGQLQPKDISVKLVQRENCSLLD